MRILYHHRTMGDGAEGIHIREIVQALRALGHEVRVEAVAGDPTQPTVAGASRARWVRRLIPGFVYELAELAYNVVGYRRLLRAAREFEPAVIYDRYNSYSTPAMKVARRIRRPLLLEVNSPVVYERSAYERLPLRFPRLADRYEQQIFGAADRVIVVSTPLRDHLVDSRRIDPGKILVLPNGADPDVFAPRDGTAVRGRYGLDARIVIGFIGILRPWHGVDLLLEAFAAIRSDLPAVHLLIVGDGPVLTMLETRARELRVQDDVIFTGRVAHAAVVDHIAAMDICVSPHATFYASPMKILEYQAMARPVVAPRMPNILDIVDDGATGLLFEPRNADALAGTLRRLVEDADLRHRLGQEGRRRVIERFNWQENASRIVEAAAALIPPEP